MSNLGERFERGYYGLGWDARARFEQYRTIEMDALTSRNWSLGVRAEQANLPRFQLCPGGARLTKCGAASARIISCQTGMFRERTLKRPVTTDSLARANADQWSSWLVR